MTEKPKQKQNEQAIYTWNGPDHIRYQKGKLWYVIAFLIAVLLFTWALFEGSIPMMISTIAAVVVYYIYDQQMPQEVEISISNFGIHVGNQLTPFSDLKSFSIDYRPPLRAVFFQHKSSFKHDVGVLFPEDLQPDDLRHFLLTQIPEQKPEDSNFIDSLLKTLRF